MEQMQEALLFSACTVAVTCCYFFFNWVFELCPLL